MILWNFTAGQDVSSLSTNPGAARAIIVAGSDLEGTSPKLFWPETLVYLLPGAELNKMLTLIVAMKSETPC